MRLIDRAWPAYNGRDSRRLEESGLGSERHREGGEFGTKIMRQL